MNFWWIKNKYSQFISFIKFLKISPDINLRVFVICISLLMILISFSLGFIIGRKYESDRSISFSNFSSHVSYDKNLLASIGSGSSALFAKNIEDKNYIASQDGKVYYHKNCKSYSRIKEENRVWFKTKEDAELSGYSLAKNCKI